MQALKESKKTSKRQPGTRGSSEGTGTIPGVPNESTVVSFTSSEGTGTKPGVPDEEKDITEENVILEWGSFNTVKDTTDAEINSLLEVKIHSEVLHIQSPSMLRVPVSLRVAKLEKDMSELKKIDISTKALAVLKTQVPSVVDNYLGSKIKKEQAEKQKMLKFTIKSTDKAALKELYHALMEALIKDENAMDKGVADTVKDHKRKHDDDEDPPAGPNQGKKTNKRRTKESESFKKPSTTKETPKSKAPSKGSKTGKSASAKEPVEEPTIEVVVDDANEDVVYDDDQPQDSSEPKTTKTPNPKWFTQPPRPPTPNLEWNKHQYVLNRLKIDNLTQDILLGPAYNLLKGTCSSNIELEYHLQECFNALTNKIDWNNLKGDRYPFDLSKPLPLQGYLGHLTVAADYFFNNDLEHLKSSDPERTYTTSITKTKAARYEIKGIKDMAPTLWSPTKVGSQLNKFSKHNVYSTKKIMGVKSVSVKKLHGYGHLEEIVVKRADRQFYKFKEGDFVDLHLNDIEDMLLLAVQHKLFHLTDSDIVDFIVALRMFTRSLIIKKRVEDLQLGVESYQKKLNITPPQQTFPEIEFKELYTPSHKPPGFSDETLKKVQDELHHRIRDFRLEYNKEMPRRKWTAIDRKRSELMVELIDKQMRERRIIRNLERLVGARELEMDYKLMTRTT
ncbi:hypothetical protein Tco_0578598 [Tanacetum coccineum]